MGGKSIQKIEQINVHVQKYVRYGPCTSSIKFQTSLGNSLSFAFVKRLSTSSGVGLLLGVVLESTVLVPFSFFSFFCKASSPVNVKW